MHTHTMLSLLVVCVLFLCQITYQAFSNVGMRHVDPNAPEKPHEISQDQQHDAFQSPPVLLYVQ